MVLDSPAGKTGKSNVTVQPEREVISGLKVISAMAGKLEGMVSLKAKSVMSHPAPPVFSRVLVTVERLEELEICLLIVTLQ